MYYQRQTTVSSRLVITLDLRGQLGAFDVDESKMIAIPYDLALENLPRALERSMGVCWTIKHGPSPEALETSNDKLDILTESASDRCSRQGCSRTFGRGVPG